MDAFKYKENKLHCEDVNLSEIASSFGTPAFVYSKKALTEML